MRRALVRRRRVARHLLAFGFAFCQQSHQAGQAVKLLALTGDHIRHVFHRADQMRDPLFQSLFCIHQAPHFL